MGKKEGTRRRNASTRIVRCTLTTALWPSFLKVIYLICFALLTLMIKPLGFLSIACIILVHNSEGNNSTLSCKLWIYLWVARLVVIRLILLNCGLDMQDAKLLTTIISMQFCIISSVHSEMVPSQLVMVWFLCWLLINHMFNIILIASHWIPINWLYRLMVTAHVNSAQL